LNPWGEDQNPQTKRAKAKRSALAGKKTEKEEQKKSCTQYGGAHR